MPRVNSNPNRRYQQRQIATTFNEADYAQVVAFAGKYKYNYSQALRILAIRGLQRNAASTNSGT